MFRTHLRTYVLNPCLYPPATATKCYRVKCFKNQVVSSPLLGLSLAGVIISLQSRVSEKECQLCREAVKNVFTSEPWPAGQKETSLPAEPWKQMINMMDIWELKREQGPDPGQAAGRPRGVRGRLLLSAFPEHRIPGCITRICSDFHSSGHWLLEVEASTQGAELGTQLVAERETRPGLSDFLSLPLKMV